VAVAQERDDRGHDVPTTTAVRPLRPGQVDGVSDTELHEEPDAADDAELAIS